MTFPLSVLSIFLFETRSTAKKPCICGDVLPHHSELAAATCVLFVERHEHFRTGGDQFVLLARKTSNREFRLSTTR